MGQFPDEVLLSVLDKVLYGVGLGSFIKPSSCPPKDCLPPCCAPNPSKYDGDCCVAVKHTKGSTTSIISLKSCVSRNSTMSGASRMRCTSPCGKREEHFVLESDFKSNPCRKTGAVDRLISWAKGLPCPKPKCNEGKCKQSKPSCCQRISCKASSCADAKINIYDDGSKTVEIVERRPSHCLKQPRTILFIGILKDGTAVSFDLPENC